MSLALIFTRGMAQPAKPLAHPDNQSVQSSPMMVAQG